MSDSLNIFQTVDTSKKSPTLLKQLTLLMSLTPSAAASASSYQHHHHHHHHQTAFSEVSNFFKNASLQESQSPKVPISRNANLHGCHFPGMQICLPESHIIVRRSLKFPEGMWRVRHVCDIQGASKQASKAMYGKSK